MKIKTPSTLSLLIIVVFALWAIPAYFLCKLYPYNTNSGELGDSFGIINSFFSAMGFIGIVYTIYVQQKDVKEGKFESHFFNLMNLHNEVVKRVYYHHVTSTPAVNEKYHDIQAFHFIVDTYLKNSFQTENDIEVLMQRYNQHFMIPYYKQFAHYIESINSIFRRVTSEALPAQKKFEYLSILKASISIAERKFLFYHIALAPSTFDSRLLNYLNIETQIANEIPVTELIIPEHRDLIMRRRQKRSEVFTS